MSRTRGIRGFFAWQTCIRRIQKAYLVNHEKLIDKMMPNQVAYGLYCDEVRRYGKPFRIALSAIGYQLRRDHNPQDL